MRDILRPLALVVLAGGLLMSLLWLNTMCLDEFASKFILSDRVQRLHRLTSALLLLQTILILALVCALEMAITRKRKSEGAEPTAAPKGGPATPRDRPGVAAGSPPEK